MTIDLRKYLIIQPLILINIIDILFIFFCLFLISKIYFSFPFIVNFFSLSLNYLILRNYLKTIFDKNIEFPLFQLCIFFLVIFYNIPFFFFSNNFYLEELSILLLIYSLFFFTINFYFNKNKIMKKISFQIVYDKKYIFYFLNILLFIYFFLFFFGWVDYLKYFKLLEKFISIFCFAVIFFLLIMKKKNKYFFFYIFAFFFIFLNFFFSSFITDLFFPLILLNIIYIQYKKKINFFLILITFFLIFFQNSLKYSLRESNINITYLRQFINHEISNLLLYKTLNINKNKLNINEKKLNLNFNQTSNLLTRLSYPIETFLRISSTDPISRIENTYIHLLYSVIPRFLWNSKPENKTANEFGKAYRFIDKNDFLTSINIPLISEAKLNISNISYSLIFPIYVVCLLILQKIFLSCFTKDFFLRIAFYSIFIEATIIENSLAFLVGNIYKFTIFILLFVIASNKILNILKK